MKSLSLSSAVRGTIGFDEAASLFDGAEAAVVERVPGIAVH